MISFFNDVDVTADDPRVAAAQYFGTKGFFSGYDAKLDAPLTEAMGALWQRGFEKLQKGMLDPMQLAKDVQAAAEPSSELKTIARCDALLNIWTSLNRVDHEIQIHLRCGIAICCGRLLATGPEALPSADGFEVRVSAPGPNFTADEILQQAIDKVAASGGGVGAARRR